MEIQIMNTALQMLMPKTSSLQTRTRGGKNLISKMNEEHIMQNIKHVRNIEKNMV